MRQNEASEIVDRVREWPLEDGVGLAAEILAIGRSAETKRKATPLKHLLGLLKTDGPPPDDAACRRILEEELIAKHLR